MRKILFMATLILTCATAMAQKLEMSVNAGSTLSHFTGSGAVADSYIIKAFYAENLNRTNNTYSKNYGVGYTGDVTIKLISKKGIIFGTSAGYEVLKNKVNIAGIDDPLGLLGIDENTGPIAVDYSYGSAVYFKPSDNPAEGNTSLTNQFITISAFAGYRVPLKKASLDLMPGVDYAFVRSSKERGTAVGRLGQVSTNYERKIPNDVRLKFGVALNLGQFVINASYNHGLKNYYPSQATPPAYIAGLPNEAKIFTEQLTLKIGYCFSATAIKGIFL